MPERLPHQLTPVSDKDMFAALGFAWTEAMGGVPTKEKVLMLVAHSAFETGWWKYMHCNNVGNMKSVEGDGRDFTYFRCWEMVPKASVTVLQAHPQFGHLVELESVGVTQAKIWLNPDHPGCRFRAYRTLKLGVADHFLKLIGKYSDDDPAKDAWGAVVRCDPHAFVHALKMKNYFTADEATYTKQVSDIFTQLCKKEFDTDQFGPTPEEVDELRNWRLIATNEGMKETFEKENPDDSDVS